MFRKFCGAFAVEVDRAIAEMTTSTLTIRTLISGCRL